MVETLAIPRFDRNFFDPSVRFKAIGDGGIGGKAHGLLLADGVLAAFDASRYRRIEISIPSLTVLRADLFDDFVERNDLRALASSDEDDEDIARAFLRGELPTSILGDLRALCEQVRTPLAIRSSSLLEDDLAQPFAGVYETKMIPNNQPSPDDRFRRLVEAVKFVWASTYFRNARQYLAAAGRAGQSDHMAVIVQEVVGTRFRERFYPHVSGVARSWNHYPMGHARPKDGVASLALGLGKQIVDGGLSWTYSPAWPTAPPPFSSAVDLVRGTQTSFWAVNMGKPPAWDPTRETEYLVEGTLADAEEDGTLLRIASTFDAAAGRVRMGIGSDGPRVLDFAMLLALPDVPINPLLRDLLPRFEEACGAPVEIEFAMTLDPNRFGLLQVRPMMVSNESVEVAEDELRGDATLLASDRALGNGTWSDIVDVVYVRRDAPAPLDTRTIARELDAINRELVAASTPYLLLGFGRWGSSDPSLGIPVVWSQIAGAKVLVEATSAAMNVELSQGSHFFHNLSAFRVPYLAVPPSGRLPIDWEWLDAQKVVTETANVRHVRCASPLEVRVDGRTGRGVVRKG